MSEQGPSFLRVAATLVTEAGLAVGGVGCASTTANASAEAEKQLNPSRPTTTEVLAAPPTQTPLPTEIAVMASPTAEPTTTLESTATAEPTRTMEPSATSTETALPKEDFSDLHPSKTIAEAMQSKDLVKRNDIFSGRLIREAKSRVKPFDESIQPAKVYLDDEGTGVIAVAVTPEDTKRILEDPSKSPCQIISVYPFKDFNRESYLLIQRWKTTEGDKYLQYLIPKKDFDQGIQQLSKQVIITPHYQELNMDSLISASKASPDNMMVADMLWYKNIEKVQAMMEEWTKTGAIPDELALYPLFPRPTSRYIP